MKALSKEPGARYPSGQAFSDAFTAAAHTTAMATPLSANGVPAAATGDESSGLFGKMKGLFRRS